MRILVTRPEPYCSRLCQKIQDLHFQAVPYPTLTFLPPSNIFLFEQQISKLNEFHWLIFLSQQAVLHSVPKLRHYFKNFHGKVAAVGLGTATALQDENIPVDCYPLENWTSEGLLELFPFQQCQSMKIALIKGEEGRQWLGNELKARGAEVIEINCYRRVQPAALPLDSDTIDVIIITSIESLQNLKKMSQNWERMLDKILLAISNRIKVYAEKLGFKKIILMDNASDEAILNTLRKMP